MLVRNGAPSVTAAPGYQLPGASRHLPVMIVCAPRPRVGRTLIARLLVEYFLGSDRRVQAFDVNPNDPMLSQIMPAHTHQATIGDTRGQMSLFDRLIINDGRPKVIDLAPALFDPFFDVVHQIGFVDGARARSIDTVALFVVEDHTRSVQAYRRLIAKHPGLLVVPVHNRHCDAEDGTRPQLPSGGTTPIEFAALSPLHQAAINRQDFSFRAYLEKPTSNTLRDWISGAFAAFRNIELRLMMSEFAPLFRPPG